MGKNNFNILLNLACSNCGSFWDVKHGYCTVCLGKILANFKAHTFQHTLNPNVLVRALFLWIKDESRFKNRLILSLKGEDQQEKWSVFAKYFCYSHKLAFDRNTATSKTCIIPISTGKKDHGYFFAKSISEVMNFDLIESVYIHKMNKQKKLTITERSQAKLQAKVFINCEDLNEKNTAFLNKYDRVIIADDVFTTGNTTELLISKLLHPNIEVWVLAHRELG